MTVPGDYDDIVKLGPSDGPAYGCEQCGKTFDVEHYVCPSCGAFAIDRRPLEPDGDSLH